MQAQAATLLTQMLGPEAQFRDGQWEAIAAVAQHRRRVLLVQRTGWGKSIVYFLATQLLRQAGAGPTLLISPLLALMRNQIEMASRIGIRAHTINSAQDTAEWDTAEASLRAGTCDVLLVSPERLANERFLTQTLPAIHGGIGLFVVDEAHCISDWGHDFRPDYRRIVRIVRGLPTNIPVLATTATANNRVVDDIRQQLGQELQVLRGSLGRESLRLHVLNLPDQADRLAWLAHTLPHLPGTGIIYCLTVKDSERVARWLQDQGLAVEAYNGQLESAERERREQLLLRDEVKALAATVALGMGFDKPDLGFVVHYQRPGSLVAYYQQIGRAGRAVDKAYVVLLSGDEDDEIAEYFIETAFPGDAEMAAVLETLARADDGLSVGQILQSVNVPLRKVEQCLRFLEIEGAVSTEGRKFFRSIQPWQPDSAHYAEITRRRYEELGRIRAYTQVKSCLMEYIARDLDDPAPHRCGHCANCQPHSQYKPVPADLVRQALEFLNRDFIVIEPRKRWPLGGSEPYTGAIPTELQIQEGRCLARYGDPGWGKQVAEDKYRAGKYREALVEALVHMIRDHWRPDPFPTWVTAIPSLRHPTLVANLAQRLAQHLGLPFLPVLRKRPDTAPQKAMLNSQQQAHNVLSAFTISEFVVPPLGGSPNSLPSGPVFLVDDLVDSRWTLTVCGMLLRQAGAGPVFPVTLAQSTTTGGHVE